MMLDGGGGVSKGGGAYGTPGALLGPTAPSISLNDLVELAAVDSDLYCRTFFPKTFRQPSTDGHREMWDAFDDKSKPRVNARCFRGFGKTANFRAFVSKRVAYRISKTILYVGISEAKAVAGVRWLRAQVERNKIWAQTFGLIPGAKWQEHEIEIKNTIDGTRSWITAAGISSGLRGINFDDFRPDLIIIDDVVDEENAATLEQREKISDLVLGSVMNSLAPPTDEPNAKMLIGQTPIHREDISARAAASPFWHTVTYPCWSHDTVDLPAEQQRSSWEARFPTEFLQKLRSNFIFENKLSLWSREWECRLTTPETSSFRSEWIQYYDNLPPGLSVLVVDPVPPPSPREVEKNLQGKDFEVVMVVTKAAGGYFVAEYSEHRGHEPLWTVAKVFELARRYNVIRIAVESVGYQRALRSLIENEMKRTGRYYAMSEVPASRSKLMRITNALSGLLAHGKLHVARHHVSLIRQLTEYPNTAHDDVIDALAIAIQDLGPQTVTLGDDEYDTVDESAYRALAPVRRCP